MSGRRIVVMGVSAAGKSSVGRALADLLPVPFVDADALHPRANVEKMAAGMPLDDADRAPWLDAVGARLAGAETGIVVACSALRRTYRDRLRTSAPDVVFVHLTGSEQLLRERAEARTDHFMPAQLLRSQLDTLEALGEDEHGFALDVAGSVEELARNAAGRLG
ncbi:gluconokinase [Microbacterium jejuense]|uniref:Gluconokinase n=1 Tax=Microbacterium jejuense TaxID=1263637 RepID=A0ABS7HS04_9MICO|nr:gluconokinase [Microbacterium jejuense]MBW9095658.1 gluconokinase [Microbacterium jejuense]